jgi:hypothetical protein
MRTVIGPRVKQSGLSKSRPPLGANSAGQTLHRILRKIRAKFLQAQKPRIPGNFHRISGF